MVLDLIKNDLFTNFLPISYKHPTKRSKIDFTGEKIGDQFIVGYGLDYEEVYRNLPYVGYLKGE